MGNIRFCEAISLCTQWLYQYSNFKCIFIIFMDTVGSLGQKKKHKSCDRSKGVRQIRHRKREWNSCKLLGAVHKRRRQLGGGEGVKNYSKMLKIVLKICRYGVGGVINSEKLPTSFMDDHLGIFSSPNEEVKRHN